jgi:hypothetical protein
LIQNNDNDGDGDGGAAANVFDPPTQTRNIFDNRNRRMPEPFVIKPQEDEDAPINAVNRYLNEAVSDEES